MGTSRSRVDLFMMRAFLQYYTFHHGKQKLLIFSNLMHVSKYQWKYLEHLAVANMIYLTLSCSVVLRRALYLQDHSKHVQISKDCQTGSDWGIDWYQVGGLEHEFYFSIYWEFHHPNWRTHIFQKGRSTTNQELFCMGILLVSPKGENGWCFFSEVMLD